MVTDIEMYKACNYHERDLSLLDFYQKQGRDLQESSPSFLSVIRAESFRIIVQTLLLQSNRLVLSPSPSLSRTLSFRRFNQASTAISSGWLLTSLQTRPTGDSN